MQYNFADPSDYNSIELVEKGSYKILQPDTPDTENRNLFMTQAVNEFSPFKACMNTLKAKGLLERKDIERIITQQSNLSGSTIPRRASSIEAWLKWIAEKTGAIKYEHGTFYAA